MLRAMRLLEDISGEKLVYLDSAAGVEAAPQGKVVKSLNLRIEELETENEALKTDIERLKVLVCQDHPQAELCQE